MRFGLSIPPFTDVATLLEMASQAEAAGWDGLFLWDHMVWDTEHRLDVHDPWVLLGAMAARTERMWLGTLVTPLARRRPQVVAKHLTTLDHLTNGRAVLGVGLGEPGVADFGDFGDPAERRDQASVCDEALSVLDGLLRGRVDHHGQHFDVTAEVSPRTTQQPRLPIWIGATAPYVRPLERARRWDGVVPIAYPNGYMTPDEIVAYIGEDRPDGWDVCAMRAPDVPVDDYRAIGTTWLIDSTWPVGDWASELRTRIHSGPSA